MTQHLWVLYHGGAVHDVLYKSWTRTQGMCACFSTRYQIAYCGLTTCLQTGSVACDLQQIQVVDAE